MLPNLFEERNDIYVREVIDLGEKYWKVDKSQLNPEDLDYIITVSCTGIHDSVIDAYLIKLNCVRIFGSATEMVCCRNFRNYLC
jgi:predicted naringenin-chalcone synthase